MNSAVTVPVLRRSLAALHDLTSKYVENYLNTSLLLKRKKMAGSSQCKFRLPSRPQISGNFVKDIAIGSLESARSSAAASVAPQQKRGSGGLMAQR
jgi:hypothetical protein